MDSHINESAIDYALQVLAHPEWEETDEFRQWMHEKSHRELYAELKAAYDGMALDEIALPRAEDEWLRFSSKIQNNHSGTATRIPLVPTQRKHYNFLKWSAAAVVLLLIGFSYGWHVSDSREEPQPITIMQSLPLPQEVVLSKEHGEQIVLSGQMPDTLDLDGAKVKSNRTIAYNEVQEEPQPVEMHTLKTPRGKDFQIILPDGTKVWLNAESSLHYPSRFTGNERVVELDGEAFFKVSKDAEHPFIVRTHRLTTQVRGTSFNFRAYGNEPNHVTLVEGSVAVGLTGQPETHTLTPGHDATLDPQGIIRVQAVNVEPVIAWTEGYFYFEDLPLSHIMTELGRWYNLTIHFQETKSMNYRFNFWANRKASIESTIEQLNQLGKVHATLNASTITIE